MREWGRATLSVHGPRVDDIGSRTDRQVSLLRACMLRSRVQSRRFRFPSDLANLVTGYTLIAAYGLEGVEVPW